MCLLKLMQNLTSLWTQYSEVKNVSRFTCRNFFLSALFCMIFFFLDCLLHDFFFFLLGLQEIFFRNLPPPPPPPQKSKFSLHESCKQHHIRIGIPYLEKRTLRGRYSNSLVIDAGSQFNFRRIDSVYLIVSSVES